MCQLLHSIRFTRYSQLFACERGKNWTSAISGKPCGCFSFSTLGLAAKPHVLGFSHGRRVCKNSTERRYLRNASIFPPDLYSRSFSQPHRLPHSSSSSSSSTVFAYPSSAEVSLLLVQFPEPQTLITLFLSPIACVDPAATPHKTLVSKYGGKCFKCQLHFRWPTSFSAAATADTAGEAERNAYLVACRTLAKLGLLVPEKTQADTFSRCRSRDIPKTDKRFKRAVTQDLYRTAWCWGKRFVVDMRSTLASRVPNESSDNRDPSTGVLTSALWRCHVTLDWPAAISVSSMGRTQSDAERNACVLACLQLRSRNLFDSTLSIPAVVMEKLLAAEKNEKGGVEGSAKETRSSVGRRRRDDVEMLLWTDAGCRGFGGYYRRQDASRKSDHNGCDFWENLYSGVTSPTFESLDRANYNFGDELVWPGRCRTWLHQSWPDFIVDSFLNDNSNFLEFYAAVSAFYTWRRTFRGKRVTLFTDNEAVANFVNRGIPDWVYLDENHGRWDGNVKAKSFRRMKEAHATVNSLGHPVDVNHDHDDPLRHHSYFYVAHLHSLLNKTKFQLDVDLSAVAIPREENRRADALARGDVASFKSLGGPEGVLLESELPKRAKQLSFLPVFRLFPFLPSVGGEWH